MKRVHVRGKFESFSMAEEQVDLKGEPYLPPELGMVIRTICALLASLTDLGLNVLAADDAPGSDAVDKGCCHAPPLRHSIGQTAR